MVGHLFIYVSTWHLWRAALTGDASDRPLGNLFAVATGVALSVAITLAAHSTTDADRVSGDRS